MTKYLIGLAVFIGLLIFGSISIPTKPLPPSPDRNITTKPLPPSPDRNITTKPLPPSPDLSAPTKPLPSSPDLSAPTKPLPPNPDQSYINDIKDKYERELLALPGVVSVGISEQHNQPCIAVYYERITPPIEEIPSKLDGVFVCKKQHATTNEPPLPIDDNSAKVTLRPLQTFQTIQGWGISLPGVVAMSRGTNPLASFPQEQGNDNLLDGFYPLLFDRNQGLGITHISFYPHKDSGNIWSGTNAMSFEETNDNDDPNVINWSGFSFSPDWPNFKVLQKTVPYNVVLKLQLGPTALPAWMKDSNNNIQASQRDEFAEYVAAFLLYLRDTMNINVPLLTILNEPDNITNAANYAVLLNRVAVMLDNKGLNTKIVAPEVSFLQNAVPFSQAFINDPVIKPRLAALSTHPYASDNQSTWQGFAKFAQNNNLPVWQGEIAAYSDKYTMQNALDLALKMRRQLIDGNVSVWYNFLGLGCECGTDGGNEGGLIIFQPKSGSNYTYLLPPRYYAFGQFSRYVRPGDIRIGIDSSDRTIRAIAFAKPDKSSVVVLINTGGTDKTVTINGLNNINSVNLFRTSKVENGQLVGSRIITNNSLSLTLPALSITTVVKTEN